MLSGLAFYTNYINYNTFKFIVTFIKVISLTVILNMTVITTLERYGKVSPVRKFVSDFQSAFKVNEHSRNLWKSIGIGSYLPELKKRFYLATGVSLFIASPVVPGGFVGVPVVMKWGLK